MGAASQVLRRTPLHERHESAGARLVAFSGWEMPIQYAGIRHEHMAVRRSAGVFDVSHMGQIETTGPDAGRLLQRLLSNDVSALDVGGAQYSVLCRDDGGVLDDCITYQPAPGRYLTVTNAANHERDLRWFREHAGDLDVTLADRLDDHAMLAVQGPRAREIAGRLASAPLPPRMRTATLEIAGVAGVLACGTGYTGEDGVELLAPPEGAARLWDALVAAGAAPAGLGARDTLRLEACLPLYGNDLGEDRGPIEAGLAWCCREQTGFIGAEAVRAVREAGPAERLVPFALTARGIPRAGNPVVGGGVVTSGTLSPCLDAGAGLAYVPSDRSAPGTPLEIDVRGTIRPAEVRSKPLYAKQETRLA